MVTIIVLKSNLEVDSGQGSGHELEGQLELNQVSVWIKVIIIVILKLDSRVESGQGREGQLEVTKNEKKKKNNLVLRKEVKKKKRINRFFTYVLS
jgi:hypothetical protein